MFKTRKESGDFVRRRVAETRGHGLEISPSINPIVRTTSEISVEYLDVCSTEELKKRASEKGKTRDCVPLIDHKLDFHRPISECVGGQKFDFAITSHVIEHIPDLIGHFLQIDEILNSGGVYVFLAPDKDLCFDCQKPDTSLGELLQAHVERRDSAPLSAMIDEFYYGAKRGDKAGWRVSEEKPLRQKYRIPSELIKGVLANPR